MKKLFIVIALFISAVSFGQGDRMKPVYNFRGVEIADWYFQPTNYVYINQRYRWFMGYFQSGFNTPYTTGYPSLGTGQYDAAGAMVYRTTDTSFYGYSGYQWTRLASSQSVNQALANCYGLLNGLAVSYLSGLTFDVSPGDFTLGCFNFHSNGGQVTGTAAHATLARIDVVLVDTLGAVSILAGTAAADPSKPQVDPSYQLELTFYTVAALATTPTGVSSVSIYLNNAPEWTATQNNWTASVAANFDATTDPFEGAKHILISNTGTVGPAAELKFVNGSVLNIADYTVLKFYIKPVSNFTVPQGISLRLGNGTAFVSPLVPVRNGDYGFQRGLNSWQLINIPISAFNVTGTQFDRLYIYPISGAKNFYLDVIQLQAGVTQPPSGDPSTTNELQTLANTSAATTHTATLSHSGGSVQLVEGSNITLTTTGTALNGIVTIASTAGGGDVTKVGTPANNQVAVWTGDGTLEGEANLQFSSGGLSINNTGGNNGTLNFGYGILKEIVALGAPGAGYGGLYAKDDGTIHYINSSSVDFDLTAGAAGITNLNDIGDATGIGSVAAANNDQTWTFDGLSGKNGFQITSSTTAAAGNNQRLFNLLLTGVNATASQFTGALSANNTHTGTGAINAGVIAGASGGAENYAVYASVGGAATINAAGYFDAQGGTTNYGIWVDNGITRFDGELNINGSAGTTGQVLTSAGAGATPTWETPSGGGGVNAGAALKATYYPSAGSTVDDWAGVEFNNTNLNTKIIAQATTDVILELRMAASQTGDPFVIKNSAGNNVVQFQDDGKALFTQDATAALQNPDGFDQVMQLYGSGNAQFQVTSGSAYAQTLQLLTHPSGFQGGLGGGNIGMRSNNALNFTTNATVRATFTAAGEFLIGTTTDGGDAKLQVSGNVLVAGRVLQTQGADVASAAGAIAVGSDGNTFELTGTNAVTLISNVGWQNGSEIIIVFTSTASLTDGTANSGTDIGMELAGNANFTGSADDVITLVLTEIGGVQRWREKSRTVN